MVDPKTLVEIQEWYTPEFDRKELKSLMKKDNNHDLYIVGLWIVLLGASGVLAFFSIGTLWIRNLYPIKGYYVTEDLCTHKQAPLGYGAVEDGCRVACPKHNACFSYS